MPERQVMFVGPAHGAITVVGHDWDQVLVLAGDIDTVVITAFERAEGGDPAVVSAIDAGDVTLLSATAVDVMLRFLHVAGAAGHPLVLRRSNPHVDRVLELLGLADAFPRGPGAA